MNYKALFVRKVARRVPGDGRTGKRERVKSKKSLTFDPYLGIFLEYMY
jgi:hypothetical protein